MVHVVVVLRLDNREALADRQADFVRPLLYTAARVFVNVYFVGLLGAAFRAETIFDVLFRKTRIRRARPVVVVLAVWAELQTQLNIRHRLYQAARSTIGNAYFLFLLRDCFNVVAQTLIS